MTGNNRNIIVGAARVYIGPSFLPTDTTVTAGSGERQTTFLDGKAGWRDVGYTQDGVEVATDPSWGEVEVDQLLDSAKIFKDGMSLSISTTFAEATLDNLAVAWGQADSTISRVNANESTLRIAGGALGERPFERGLVAIGNGPENQNNNTYSERAYFAYRVLSVEGASHTLARADATTVPVTFRALPADNGEYGFVRDRYGL